MYFLGQTISSLGDGFYLIAFVWLSMRLSGGKGIVMGGVLSIYTVGEVVFGLIAGPIVDRFDRKRILIITDMIRGIIVLSVFIMVLTARISLLNLYVCVALFAVFTPIFHRAEFAIIPQLIEKEYLMKANGLLAGARRAMQIMAPILAGVVIAVAGVSVCFLLDALSFALSMALTMLLRVEPVTLSKAKNFITPLASNFALGFKCLMNSPFLLALGIYAACVNFFAGPIFPLIPLLTEKTGIGASGYGVIMGGLSAGMIAASFMIGFVGKRADKVAVMLTGLAFSALAIMSMSIFENFLLIISAVVLGIGLNVTNIPITTIFQQEIPKERLGVVSSFVFTIAQIAMPVSMLLSGVLVDIFSVKTLFALIGLIVFAAAIIGFLLPQLRGRTLSITR